MRHYGFKKRRRITGNVVIHVPSTMAGTMVTNAAALIVIESPSIFAGGSASDNIEAQDKDRTVNVGHHIGRLNLDLNIRTTVADGIVEFAVYKVERAASTPSPGAHPVPSAATILSQGIQQAVRLDNPGKTFHFSNRAYTAEHNLTHKIIVSPAKYKLSKVKAGDHWLLQMFNRGSGTVTYDVQMRYKEYE